MPVILLNLELNSKVLSSDDSAVVERRKYTDNGIALFK